MRENIGLYRGKRIDNDEWVEGWYYKRIVHLNTFHQNVVMDAIEVYDGENPLSIAYYNIGPDTVGECSGIPDRANVFIFEGDILKITYLCQKPVTAVVELADGKFTARYGRNGKEHIDNLTAIASSLYKIIGNIHDNPELLEAADG